MGVSHRALSKWYYQLAQNLEAGIPLIQSVREVKGAPPRDRMKIADRLQSGESVQQVTQDPSPWWPRIDRMLISSADSTGHLPEALHKLSRRHDQAARNILKTIVALIYPLFVIHFGIFLIPVLSLVTFGEGSTPTFHLMNYVRGVTTMLAPLWMFFAIIIFLASEHKGFLKATLGALPGLRQHFRYQSMANFCYTLESFVASGACIDDGWGAAGEASGNKALAKASRAIVDFIKSGQAPGDHLERFKVFPDEFVYPYRAGEKTGQLDANLGQVAQQYQDKADRALALSSFWYPKLIFIGFAIYAGIRVMSLFSGYLDLLYEMMGL